MLTFKIKPYLKEKDITLTKMARDIGISRQTLSAISNNSVTMLNLNTINKIANYLNVPGDKLLVDDPDTVEISVKIDTFGGLDKSDKTKFLIISDVKAKDSFQHEEHFELYIYINFLIINGIYNNVTFTLSMDEDFYTSSFYRKLSTASSYKNQNFIMNLIEKCFKQIDFKYDVPFDSENFGITVTPNINFWSFNFTATKSGKHIMPVLKIKDDYNDNDSVNYII
ncbi:helix-turn-helix domain-containing protein [Nicoliella lavandulae]|uniref:Helix-turn-helix transcriptional regulator n=1 Tax=Nicoliella lavandulae TaxID=3082954 RepID=A0ABU8SJ71_9LACO